MSGKLYILSGASGCGKTTLLNRICAESHDEIDPITRAVRAPKYSEREVRVKDGEPDDIIHVDHITLDDFDIAYVINNTRYGIRVDEISSLLDQGLNAFIVLSDFRVVRQVKEAFQARAKALYVSSAIDADRLRRIQRERLGFSPDDQQKSVLNYHFHRVTAAARLGWWDRVSECVADFEADWRTYATDAVSTEIRAQRIRAFHIRYIEFLHLFDHVVLNYTEDRPDEMISQARNIILHGDEFITYKSKSYPPVFVIAAASGSGKGTLMEMLNFLGRDRVKITSKIAKRERKDGDKRDGMIPILGLDNDPVPPNWPDWWTDSMIATARAGEFPPEYDLRWSFHRDDSLPTEAQMADQEQVTKREVWYAVSSAEIEKNIAEGYPQIFVSNIQQFPRFREVWPNHAVMIYLHRLTTSHALREFLLEKWKDDRAIAEIRFREKETVHRHYIDHISEFDHVLLNTSFEEDVFDQLLRLVEHYHDRRE